MNPWNILLFFVIGAFLAGVRGGMEPEPKRTMSYARSSNTLPICDVYKGVVINAPCS